MEKIDPRKIRLEGMSVCQLRCPTCPTTTGAIRPAIASGYLTLKDFARLVDENPRLRHVELSNFGEIFLNPDLLAIMQHAHRQGVVLSADNGINLNTATSEQLEGLVRYRFRSATVSIDGASQETYQRYRVRGNLDTVLHNVRIVNHLKRKHCSRRPRLAWQFVVFGHNEHELPRAREMASALGMEFRPKLSYDDSFSPVRDRDFVRRQLAEGVASRDEFDAKRGVHYARPICLQLWNEPQINFDGTLLGCCVNFWGDFGSNAFREGLRASVNSERIRYARQMLMGHRPARDDVPCVRCGVYQSMQRNGRWLTRSELRRRPWLRPRLKARIRSLAAAIRPPASRRDA